MGRRVKDIKKKHKFKIAIPSPLKTCSPWAPTLFVSIQEQKISIRLKYKVTQYRKILSSFILSSSR